MHRVIRIVLPVTLVVMALGAVVLAQSVKSGGPVNVLKATPVSDLYASPDKFVGKTIRVDGMVTSVCTDMGCWVAVRDMVNPDQTVRFQADHDGKIVFPLTLKGKSGSFQGEFVKIGANDKEAHEAAAEHAHSEPKAADFGSRYQIKVTGWVSERLDH
jgi:hypothetical protein